MAAGGTTMQCEPFDSSVIRAAGDDPATGTREVAFRNHRIYRYLDVPL
jgi:KTSC domain-containing protein